MDGQMDKVKGSFKQAAGKADEFRGTVKNNIDKAADTLKKQV